MGYQETYQTYLAAIEHYLGGLFLGDRPYGQLQEAMRYSLLAGGKRVRPVLTCAFAELFGGEWEKAVPLGCALELIHTYSLIHDDLPCMDNDDLRRGKPTCHKVYGETLAVLAGDALQPEAFAILAAAEGLSAQQRIDAVAVLARAAGGDGMVAGQVLDLDGKCRSREQVELLHSLKTGAMIAAAAELGCVAANAAPEQRQAARDYAREVGLAFQIRDDMLDVIADQTEFGKPIGSDREEGKTTFVDLIGLDGCEREVAACTGRAKAALSDFPGNGFLLELADQLAERRK